ncbi:NAD-P-binding protein [Hysterangium stoloniferum]|nr:NAD-P-binding protein [Hysterangium stoloniferum]
MDSSPPTSQKIWLITGTSTGLGREIALAALAAGDKIIATSRSLDKLVELQTSHPEDCKILQLDVTSHVDTITTIARKAVSLWGRIDVLVNNAGFAIIGNFEEGGIDAMMHVYNTNVFGVINVTNAFLPYMRQRGSGTIVFIGSRSGWRTQFKVGTFYGSSKAAIHAIADTLYEELKPQGIRVVNAVPGAIRTPGIGKIIFAEPRPLPLLSADPAADSMAEVPEYANTNAAMRKHFGLTAGKETGNPTNAAKVIVDVVRKEGVAAGRSENPSLFLGSEAVRDAKAKCEAVLKTLEEWGDVAKSIDFPNGL